MFITMAAAPNPRAIEKKVLDTLVLNFLFITITPCIPLSFKGEREAVLQDRLRLSSTLLYNYPPLPPVLYHLADDSGAGEGCQKAIGIVRRGDKGHADPHVEHSIHLLLIYVAPFLNQSEDGRDFPGASVELCCQPWGQDSGQVINEPAAGDMSQSLDLGEQRLEHMVIAAMGLKELLA